MAAQCLQNGAGNIRVDYAAAASQNDVEITQQCAI
jgi:hypothetical protein